MIRLGKQKFFGLDLGERSWKGVTLRREGKEVLLDDYFFYDLMDSMELMNSPANRADMANALIDGIGMRDALVAGTIPDRELKLVELSLPKLPKKELDAAIKGMVEARLNLSAADLSIEYTVDSSGKDTRVRAYCVPMESVRERLETLEKAQLRPLSLETTLQASVEAMRFNDYVTDNDCSIVVDLGESHTTLGIVAGGELAQVNVLRRGSGDVNQQIMQKFSCSYADAEQLKNKFSLEDESDTEPTGVEKVIEESYLELVQGIIGSVNYFRANFKSYLFMNILLVGGGAQKPGIATILERSLGIPVIQPNPLRKIQIFDSENANGAGAAQVAPMLHAAIGLALRKVA